MSITLNFPIHYILKSTNEDSSELELIDCVTCTHSLLKTNDGIRLVPYWGIDLYGDGNTYELYIGNRYKDEFFQDTVIFSGFHNTAMNIIHKLGIKKEDYSLF